MKYILIILCLLLVSCIPAPIPPDPSAPVTSIRIEPDRADVELGESIELACLDQLDRLVVAIWSKRCGAGTLSIEIGETCVYTVPKRITGTQQIYADFEGLRAIANIKGIKEMM